MKQMQGKTGHHRDFINKPMQALLPHFPALCLLGFNIAFNNFRSYRDGSNFAHSLLRIQIINLTRNRFVLQPGVLISGFVGVFIIFIWQNRLSI